MGIKSKSVGGFLRTEGGNVAILGALLIAPLLIAGGMALDFSRAAQARAIVQEAADGALLRVARLRSADPGLTDADLTTEARRIFDAATVALEDIVIDGFAVVYDDATKGFRLDVEGDIDTALMNIAGVETMKIDTLAEVKLGPPPYMEVVLALDNTGSMNDGDKIGSLRTSAAMLVESLFSSPDAEVKVGLVPFAQYVNVGAANAAETWMGATPAGWSGCVGSRNYPANTEDSGYAANRIPAIAGGVCPNEILPLTDDKAAILAAVGAMSASGWTYIAEGVAWGRRVLSEQAPFTGGLSASAIDARGGSKVMILLTDGMNTKAPTYPEHDSADTTLANSLTDRLCDEAKADGVEIYAIAFDVTDPGVRTLLEDCGTTAGHYFEPANASDLAAVFAEIGSSLRNLSLSK